MARTFYGGSGADVVAKVDTDGDFEPATVTFTVWSTAAGTAGTQLTDLLNASLTAVTSVTPDSYGRILFYGPDGYSTSLWLKDPSTGILWRFDPSDLATRLGGVVSIDIGDGNGPQTGAVSLDIPQTPFDIGAAPIVHTHVAADVVSGTFAYALMPAGFLGTVFKSGSTWPSRPSSRTDIAFRWVGQTPGPAIVNSGTAGALNNVDTWRQTV